MEKGLDIDLKKLEQDLKNSKPYFIEVPESIKPSEREIMLLKNLYLWLDMKPNGVTEYNFAA